MGLSFYNIKKWMKMILGNSALHVNQGIGQFFAIGKLQGYYNDLTEKVSFYPNIIDNNELPLCETESGDKIVFPVAVFQYALGLYDLYLKTGQKKYINKFKQCADWILEIQDEKGRINNFFYIYPDAPYGAMAQGEAASVLARAYVTYKEEAYYQAASKAVMFMLKSVDEGGVTKYEGENVFLLEYTHLPTVLNGWIFAWWGLYDYTLINSEQYYIDMLQRSLATMVKSLAKFSNNFWSFYDIEGKKIASPFYHNLHIAQLEVMYELTGKSIFCLYANKWRRYQSNPINKIIAFLAKSFQKIMEK